MTPANLALRIDQGATFRALLRLMQPNPVYKPITAIAATGPVRLTVEHSLPGDWPVWVEHVRQLPEANRAPLRQLPHMAQVVTATELDLPGINATGTRPEGGQLVYRPPLDLTDATAELRLYEKGAEVGTLPVTVNAGGWVDVELSAAETDALAWRSREYALDVTLPNGDVLRAYTGTITVEVAGAAAGLVCHGFAVVGGDRGQPGPRGAQVVASTFDEEGRLIMTLDDGSIVASDPSPVVETVVSAKDEAVSASGVAVAASGAANTKAGESAISATAAQASAAIASTAATEAAIAAAAVAGVVDAVDGAVAQAEAARDAAFVNAELYVSTAEGLAATVEGEQFQVLSTDGLEYIRYRHDSGPLATEVGRYPSSGKVQAVSDKTDGTTLIAEASDAVTARQLPGGGRFGDQSLTVDAGFNVGHRVDKHGVFVSGGMPYFNVRDTNPDTTWGVADRLGLSPISTGPAADGFPIRNPWLSYELNRRLGAAPLIAFDGDSRIDQGVDTYRTNTMGIPYWLSFLSGGRFDVRNELNFGIGGQTSTQILARVDSTIAACRAAGCTKLIALFSLNDRGSISGSAGSTAALTIANLEAYQSAILSAGIDLIWVAELPCGNPDWQAANPTEPDYGLQASATLNHLAVRRWQLAQPFKHPRVAVADPFPQMVDTTTAAINGRVGVMKDAKHESALGAYLMAQALLPIIEQRLPPLSRVTSHAADAYSSVNPGGTLLGNKTMLWGAGGTFTGGGSHTGTLPDGWEANITSGLTATFTSVPADDGGAPWLQVAITGAAAAPQWLTLSASATTVTPMVTGSEFMGVCETEIDAGHSGLIANMLRPVLTMVDTSAPHCAAGAQAFLSTDINKHLPDVALSGVAVTPPRPVPAGTASSAVLQLQLIGDTGTAVSAVVRYRLPSLNMKTEV